MALAGCLEPPAFEVSTTARIVVAWDPLACGAPHRVVVELADEDGAPLTSSVPCALGGISIEAPHLGVYEGRVYAWAPGAPSRSITPVRIEVDEPIVRRAVETPV